MDNDRKDKFFYTPIDKSAVGILIFFLFCDIWIVLTASKVRPQTLWGCGVIGVIGTLEALRHCVRWIVDPKCIFVKLFGIITIRKIPWRYVGEVYIFRSWKCRTPGKYYGRVFRDGYIVITMKWSIPFELGVDDPNKYCFRHPIDSLGMKILNKHTEAYIDGIRQFYSDIQIVEE